jgi:hypothetical protein
VPSGSLATCTMISWPSLRSSSIFGSGPFSRSRSRRPGPPAGRALSRRSASVPRGRGGGRFVFVSFEAVELLECRYDVGNVEEAVALEAEVNKRRLHAGQHFRHPAFVQVADDTARPFPLDEDFGDLIFLENRRPAFRGRSRR